MIAGALLLAAAAAVPQSEMALRCTVAADAPLLTRNTPTLSGALTGGPTATPPSRPLPQMMVEGWSVDRLPVDQALGQLGADAGFTVQADAGLQPVSWKGGPTSLSTVVTRLAQAAGGTATFDGKVLRISKPTPPAPWMFGRPSGRDATLALLDALRGYGATDVSLLPDGVRFQASAANIARIRRGLAAGTGVLAFDVWTYRVATGAVPDWSGLDAVAPVSERHVQQGGGMFVLGYAEPDRIVALLSRVGSVTALGSQTVAGPQGWAVEVPLGQCAPQTVQAGSLTLRPTWNGRSMSVEVSGSMNAGRIDAVTPGGTMVLASRPSAGTITVAVVRPRVLAAR